MATKDELIKNKVDELNQLVRQDSVMKAELQNRGFRLDSVDTIFVARQLIDIEAQVYQVQYPNLKARQHIPIKNRGLGAAQVGYRMGDTYGGSKFISQNAKDLPNVGKNLKEVLETVKHIGTSVRYTWFELMNAMFANISLDAELFLAARQTVEQQIDNVLWYGDSTEGVKGLLSSDYLSNYTALQPAANGTGSSKLFTAKTSEQIIADLANLITQPNITSKGLFRTNVVLCDPVMYNFLFTTQKASNGYSDETIGSYIEKTLKVKFDDVAKLSNVPDKSNKPLIVAMDSNIINFNGEITDEFRIHQMEKELLEYVTPCTASLAGVLVRQPKAIAYMYDQQATV